MWSSYNEFNQDTNKSVKSRNYPNNSSNTVNAASTDNNTSLTLSNSFYDSLLNSFETPSCTESDTSERSSDMDTDTEESECSEQTHLTENTHHTHESSIRLFASMDHCYNISSTQLDNDKFLSTSASGPLTPPMSSDDEESDKHQTSFKFDNGNKTSQQKNNGNKTSQ